MATEHAAEAQFLAKQAVPCAVGLGFSTVSTKRCPVRDYMCIHRLASIKMHMRH